MQRPDCDSSFPHGDSEVERQVTDSDVENISGYKYWISLFPERVRRRGEDESLLRPDLFRLSHASAQGHLHLAIPHRTAWEEAGSHRMRSQLSPA